MPNFQSYLMPLWNDTDPDGHTLALSYIATPPNHGTASVSGNMILYTPNAGYSGTDTVTYLVSDGNGGTATAVVTITVTTPGEGGVGGGGSESPKIRGRVFHDLNENDVYDSASDILFGTSVQVKLLNSSNIVVATTWTMSGLYEFTNVATGSYKIQIVLPTGYEFVLQDQGDDGTDSDVDSTGTSILFFFDAEDEDDDILDAGLRVE